MNDLIANKKVLITGAGSGIGIGQPIALKFVGEGAQLMLWGKRKSLLEKGTASVRGAVVASCDVSERAELRSAY